MEMNKIHRLWALVITISILALGAVVANSNSPSSAETVSATVTVGNAPEGVAICPAASTTPGGCAGKAYVTTGNDDAVSVIATATNTVSATVTAGDGPTAVAICPAASTTPAVVLKFTG